MNSRMMARHDLGREKGPVPMILKVAYRTPRGFSDMLMMSDGDVLTGLHFVDSCKVSANCRDCEGRDIPIFRETRRWLDIYFSGRQPDFTPSYRMDGLTPFRREVVEAMLAIPFGETATYGDIAAALAKKHGIAKMSAQAVGGAVGWNPICIIVPCHRVVGAKRSLVGYGGGIMNKAGLLTLETNHEPRTTNHEIVV